MSASSCHVAHFAIAFALVGWIDSGYTCESSVSGGMMSSARKLRLVVTIVGIALLALFKWAQRAPLDSITAPPHAIAEAFRTRASNVQVSGVGVVRRVLPDDEEGSRHQRFILELSDGQTVLVSHNIDLAARLNALDRGDTVEFFAEYDWNANGGVIHWTHHDPARRHVDGWLKHDGRIVR
jgi:hypothetical protein